jgi:hypothetical protein
VPHERTELRPNMIGDGPAVRNAQCGYVFPPRHAKKILIFYETGETKSCQLFFMKMARKVNFALTCAPEFPSAA